MWAGGGGIDVLENDCILSTDFVFNIMYHFQNDAFSVHKLHMCKF